MAQRDNENKSPTEHTGDNSRLLKNHTYTCNRLVIGNNLNAVKYAYKTNSHILINNMANIFAFKSLVHEIDLGNLKFKAGEYVVDVWKNILYRMNMAGLHPFGLDNTSVSIDLDNKIATLRSESCGKKTIKFKQVHLFDYKNVQGLPFEFKEPDRFVIYDWFAVKSGMNHDLDFIESDSNFVKKIQFYVSSRIAGNKKLKDLVSKSILSADQLKDVDYSEGIARLKILQMMQESGIKGTGHGHGYNLPLKIEFEQRQVIPIINYVFPEQGLVF